MDMDRETLNEVLTGAFDRFFRFKIGDVVVARDYAQAIALEHEINPQRDRFERLGAPRGMVIIERGLQQCHGGIQGFYTVRRWSSDREEFVRCIDAELAPWSEAAAALRAMAATRRPASAWDDAAAGRAGPTIAQRMKDAKAEAKARAEEAGAAGSDEQETP